MINTEWVKQHIATYRYSNWMDRIYQTTYWSKTIKRNFLIHASYHTLYHTRCVKDYILSVSLGHEDSAKSKFILFGLSLHRIRTTQVTTSLPKSIYRFGEVGRLKRWQRDMSDNSHYWHASLLPDRWAQTMAFTACLGVYITLHFQNFAGWGNEFEEASHFRRYTFRRSLCQDHTQLRKYNVFIMICSECL